MVCGWVKGEKHPQNGSAIFTLRIPGKGRTALVTYKCNK